MLGFGGGCEAGEVGGGTGEKGVVGGGDGEDEIDEGSGPFVGHGVAQSVEAVAGLGGGFGVAQYVVGAVEEGLEFGVEFAVVEFGHGHAAAEYGEFCGESRGEGVFGVVVAQGLEQVRHEGVDLVVGSGRFA